MHASLQIIFSQRNMKNFSKKFMFFQMALQNFKDIKSRHTRRSIDITNAQYNM